MPKPSTGAAAMRWAAAHTLLADPIAAAEELADTLHAGLGEGPVDLVVAFLSAPHVRGAATIAATLKRRLHPGCLIGGSARGVITRLEELETGLAVSAIAAQLPGVEVRPFIVTTDGWDRAAEDADEFERRAPGVKGAELTVMIGDPFTLDVERVLGACQRQAPGVRVVGGMASAGAQPGKNALFLNDWTASEGGVAVSFSGAMRADVVVSQGCSPIGPPLEITRADVNMILELDGQPALERVESVLRTLSEADRERLKQGLYVGRPARTPASGRGDYLIRNLLGADRERGALAVADRVVEHERVRLHVRDAATAREDLEMLLSPQGFDAPAHAALLFSCNGRGRMLYGEPDRDIITLQEALGGSVSAAGMFCAGEIGPVGERNFVHGHTASIVIVRPRDVATAGGPR